MVIAVVAERVSNKLLAAFVREHRQLKGLTQAQLERLAGISHGWVGHLEAGTLRGRPKPTTLEKLAFALEASFGDLLMLAGHPTILSLGGVARETPAAFPPVRSQDLPSMGPGDVPPTPWEQAIIDEARELGIGFGPLSEPDFWSQPLDARRTLLVMLRGYCEEARQYYDKHGWPEKRDHGGSHA